MRLLHPLLLLCAIPVGAIAVLLYLWPGLSIAGGRRLVAGLRLASLGLIVLALAQPQIGHGARGATVLAVDRSQSIAPGAGAVERAWLRADEQGGCEGACPVVQFGGTAMLTDPVQGLLAIGHGGPLEGGQSDIQKGLSLALARAPAGGRVVLLSDGLQTRGEASAVAAQARAMHVRVDVVGLEDDRVDAAVTRVQAPRALHAGDPLSLEVTVRSTVARQATISVTRDGVSEGQRRERLVVGDNPYLFALKAPAVAGSYSYQVRITMPGDSVRGNDALATVVRVKAQPRVTVAGEDTATVAGMLREDGMQVSVVSPGALPESSSGYAGQDAVVLDDVSATQLGQGRAGALTTAVRNGTVGLLALGGPHSFSLGRYYHSPLQAALPVSSLVPGNLQRRNVAIELVLDHSGSMENLAGEYPKIEMAQTAARVAARFLAAHRDELGIVAFEVQPKTLLPVTRLSESSLHGVDARIDGLRAEGGTNIYKGLEDGVHQIEASKAPDRHVILMTDGVSEPGSYKQLLPELRRDHISVSTVALGDEAYTPLLKAIAKSTGGQYYATDKANELPRIFAKQTRVSARPVRLRGTIPVSAGTSSPVVESLSGKLPPLRGNVVTTLKQGAQADLLSKDSEHPPDPALAQWQYGVGRVVTWTPGLGEWAGEWAQRPDLFQDAVRFVERGAAIPALTPSMAPGSDSEIEVDTIANADKPLELEEAHLTGALALPGGHELPLSFTQTAPSRYVAEVAPLAAGDYEYTVSDGGEATSGRLAVPYPAELRPAPAESTVLGPLARATGGRVLAPGAPGVIEGGWTELWPWLALAALICFLAGVALRMLDLRRPPLPPGRLRARRARFSERPPAADREVARL